MAVAEQPDMEDLSAEEVLRYMVERFHPRLYVACSFQKEASVIMDMMLKVEPTARFFTLDTGIFFPETYETWRKLEERYDIEIEVYQGMSLDRQDSLHGPELWKTDPDGCCALRKVRALNHALSEVDGWITGVRREHSAGRQGTPKLMWDDKHGLWKGNPLVDWSEKDVWRYIFKHDVPYNGLHDNGFASIGCTPCTLAGQGREGRWAKTNKVECGLH